MELQKCLKTLHCKSGKQIVKRIDNDTSCSAESLIAAPEGVTGLDAGAIALGDDMEWVLWVPSTVTVTTGLFSLDPSRILIAGLTSSGLEMQ